MSSSKVPFTRKQLVEWENFFRENNMNVATRVDMKGRKKDSFTFSFFQEELGLFHIGGRENWDSKVTDKFKAQSFCMINNQEALLCLESPTILMAIYYAELELRPYPTDYCFSLLEDEAVDLNINLIPRGRNYLALLFMLSQAQIDKLNSLPDKIQKEIYLTILRESFNNYYTDFDRVKAVHKSIVPYKLRNYLETLEDLGCIDFNKDTGKIIGQDEDYKIYTELEALKMIEEG